MNQQGLLANKKLEGKCPGDYFFFTVFVKHFSGFMEALDSKGILCTLKKVLSCRFHFRYVRNNILLTL